MKNIMLIITILLLVFLSFGCSDKELGIFYSIEQEREVEDNTIENDASIGDMVLFGESYYAAAGNLYTVNAESNFDYHTRASSEGKWSKDSNLPADKLCFSIGVTPVDGSDALLGVFYAKNGDSADDPDSHLYMKNGSSWEIVTETEDMIIEKFIGTADCGFILSYTLDSSNNRSYSIFTIDDSLNLNEISSSLTTSSYFDLALDRDSGTSKYWIIYGPGLYTIPLTDLLTGTLTEEDSTFYVGEETDDSDLLKGIYYSDIFNGLFLSKQSGAVYYRPDDGSWETLDDSLSTGPGDFIDFTMLDGTEILLAGTINGYYELDLTDGITGEFSLPEYTAEQDSYLTLDLRYSTVESFFTHSFTDTEGTERRLLFALTRNNGLWSNGYYDTSDDTEYRVWDIE